MKGGLGNLLKQAQKMQADMQQAQEELTQVKVTGEAGGGMVNVVMNAKPQMSSITLADSLLAHNDKEMLADLIVAAVNDAAAKSENLMKEKMAGMVPAGMKLPF